MCISEIDGGSIQMSSCTKYTSSVHERIDGWGTLLWGLHLWVYTKRTIWSEKAMLISIYSSTRKWSALVAYGRSRLDIQSLESMYHSPQDTRWVHLVPLLSWCVIHIMQKCSFHSWCQCVGKSSSKPNFHPWEKMLVFWGSAIFAITLISWERRCCMRSLDSWYLPPPPEHGSKPMWANEPSLIL